MRRTGVEPSRPPLARLISEREQEMIKFISACSRELTAFSISFDVTALRMRSLVYFQQPKLVERQDA